MSTVVQGEKLGQFLDTEMPSMDDLKVPHAYSVSAALVCLDDISEQQVCLIAPCCTHHTTWKCMCLRYTTLYICISKQEFNGVRPCSLTLLVVCA